jgi:hypothetical protein
MKLSKEQLQYIDDYLKRSGVIYWDVRTELLDHIATAIEVEMTKEESTFEEALETVSISFGNTMRKGYVLNKDNTKWVSVGVFSDGEGFKKLQRSKRQQIGKKYTKAYFKQLGQLFFSARFYVGLIILILLVHIVSLYSAKWAVGAGLIYLFAPFLWIMYQSIKGDIPKKSLHINISMLGLVMWLHFFNLGPNMYELFSDQKLDMVWYAWSLVLLFPFIKTSFVRHYAVCKEYKKYYDLISS